MFLTFIGDVHGKYKEYLNKITEKEYSIQLGDFGFDYSCLKHVDTTKHKILLGNHDNYDNIPKHSLGDFGVYELLGLKIFYIRGAYSIDKKYRIVGRSWWENEELNYTQCNDCIQLYKNTKPDMVISHDAPYYCLLNGFFGIEDIPKPKKGLWKYGI